MRLLITMLVVMFTAAGAWPQERPVRVQKILQVKYADPQRLANLLSVFGLKLQVDSAMKVIAVDGVSETVNAFEEALKRLDVPSPAEKNIELLFHVLMASAKPVAEKLPADLEEVARRLRAVFAYQGFSLLDTIIMRVRDGQGSNSSGATSGRLNRDGGDQIPRYQLGIRKAELASADKAAMIRIDDLRFGLQLPVSFKDDKGVTHTNYREAGMQTAIDIREGQKVVVGKATTDGSDQAVILVATARVVD